MAKHGAGKTKETLEKGVPADIRVEQLQLDAHNPRLAAVLNGTSPKELLRVLWNEMAVDEIALSIAANGYFPQEPLLVIPERENHKDPLKDKFIVVEGNRRLAAVTLLLNNALREELKATNIPTLGDQAKKKLESLPVFIFTDRASLWRHCGFRHINGTQPWDAFSKAKYISWVHETYKVDLDVLAETIGDRHHTVKRLYRGFNILRQAEAHAGFSREDCARNRFYFSHLYTALDQPEFQKFLGVTSASSLEKHPVPKSRHRELRELFTWLYGRKSQGIQPVVQSQFPDLNILREVIAKPNAIAALRSGLSLARAYDVASGDDRRFRESLTRAKDELQQAKGTEPTGYRGEKDLLELIKEIVTYAEALKTDMEIKHVKAQRKR